MNQWINQSTVQDFTAYHQGLKTCHESVLSPRLWNSLPRLLLLTLATTLLALDILSRHFFSQSTSAHSALGALAIMSYTNLRFIYLLTKRTQSWVQTQRRYDAHVSLSTWQTLAYQFQTSMLNSISVSPIINCHTMLPFEHVWLSDLLCGWPDFLEHSLRIYAILPSVFIVISAKWQITCISSTCRGSVTMCITYLLTYSLTNLIVASSRFITETYVAQDGGAVA